MKTIFLLSAALGLTACANRSALPDQGRLLATGGVSQAEGAGGAGLSTWSVITGYGTSASYGANAFYTQAQLPSFTLRSMGGAVGIKNRVEISYAKQEFDSGDTGPVLGLPQGYTFSQDILGAKVRVAGDAVYDQDSWMPQISVGAQYKKASDDALLTALGAADDEGVDVYVAATKVLLDKSLILSGALRGTKANQLGLLGFGGDQNDDYTVQFEGSAAYMVSRKVVVGADYRTKPNNLGFANEQDAKAAYIAYFPSKNVSLTAAYLDAGEVALQGNQSGAYGSIQVGF